MQVCTCVWGLYSLHTVYWTTYFRVRVIGWVKPYVYHKDRSTRMCVCAVQRFLRHEVRVKDIKALLKSSPQGHSTALVLYLVATVTDNMIFLPHSGRVFPDSLFIPQTLFIYLFIYFLLTFFLAYGGQGTVNRSGRFQIWRVHLSWARMWTEKDHGNWNLQTRHHRVGWSPSTRFLPDRKQAHEHVDVNPLNSVLKLRVAVHLLS